jgi:uroporphyrin-3 C-methyltransferase/uroporphyrinogen III methyltransferase/synthase
MLSPTQAYFLRENLKLRLLNARMALLSRNEAPSAPT